MLPVGPGAGMHGSFLILLDFGYIELPFMCNFIFQACSMRKKANNIQLRLMSTAVNLRIRLNILYDNIQDQLHVDLKINSNMSPFFYKR